jgi:hypothetical protein
MPSIPALHQVATQLPLPLVYTLVAVRPLLQLKKLDVEVAAVKAMDCVLEVLQDTNIYPLQVYCKVCFQDGEAC